MSLKATIKYDGYEKSIEGEQFQFSYGTHTSTTYTTVTPAIEINCKNKYMTDNFSMTNGTTTTILNCQNKIMKDKISFAISDIVPTTYIISIPTPEHCTLTVLGGDAETRTLSDGDTIYTGETITWTATAELGYHFDDDNNKITDSGSIVVAGDVTISKSATWSIYTITEDLQHIAYIGGEGPEKYTVSYGDNSVHFKLDSPEDTYVMVDDPYADNALIVWDCPEGGDAAWYIIPAGTGNITIHCIAIPEQMKVYFNQVHATITATGSQSSSLSNGSTIVAGETVSWTCVADAGYTLVSKPSGSITVEKSFTINAVAVEESTEVSVTYHAYPNWVHVEPRPQENYNVTVEQLVSETNADIYHTGDIVKATAHTGNDITALDPITYSGYVRFGRWEVLKNGSSRAFINGNPLESYTIPADATTLNFTAAYQVKIEASYGTEGGSATTSKDWVYPNYYDFTITATPESGYVFDGWYLDENLFSRSNPCRIEYAQQSYAKILAPRVYRAHFKPQYTVTLESTSTCEFTWKDLSGTRIYDINVLEGETVKVYVVGDIDYLSGIRQNPAGGATVHYEPEGGEQCLVTISNVIQDVTLTAYCNS